MKIRRKPVSSELIFGLSHTIPWQRNRRDLSHRFHAIDTLFAKAEHIGIYYIKSPNYPISVLHMHHFNTNINKLASSFKLEVKCCVILF